LPAPDGSSFFQKEKIIAEIRLFLKKIKKNLDRKKQVIYTQAVPVGNGT
jgi:hypothetical protein